jgi:large subunit ribosomal protein L25
MGILEQIVMENFELDITLRTDLGKGASRRLRRTGKMPGILYGSGKEAVSIMLSHNEMMKHLKHESFYSHVLTLKFGDQIEKAVLKDLHRHPYHPTLLHADFQRVSDTEKLHMHVPLHFINEDICVGVKKSGGVISRQMMEVEIYCLAKDLPEFIEVNLAEVQLGQIIHLSDLKLPEGVELVALSHGDSEHDLPVASVHAIRGGSDDDEKATEEEAE